MPRGRVQIKFYSFSFPAFPHLTHLLLILTFVQSTIKGEWQKVSPHPEIGYEKKYQKKKKNQL